MSAIRSLPGERWGNRPAPGCGYLKILGAALQADGETRSVVTASSIRRRSAAWTILLDWTYRSRRPASALWMTRAESCGKPPVFVGSKPHLAWLAVRGVDGMPGL